MRWVACGALVVCLGCGRLGFNPTADAGGGPAGDDATDARGDWWDARWPYRMKLSIDNTTGPQLDNFTVLVTLDPSRIDYSAARAGGADARFVDGNNITELAYDIEHWDTTSSFVWVRIPQIEATSTHSFWLYYGNPNANFTSDPSSTWTDYNVVWHLREIPVDGQLDIDDSTGNNNMGQTRGGMTIAALGPGVIGNSLLFDGVDDWITGPSSPSLQLIGSITIQLWVNVTTARNQWLADFVQPVTEQESGNHLYEFALDNNSELELDWEEGGGNDVTTQSTIPITTPPGQWAHFAVVRDAVNDLVTFYENGAPLGTQVGYGNDPTGGTGSILYLAGELDGTSSKLPLHGRVDEFRIVDEARTPAWMAADYRSMTDALINYGAPQSY